MGELDTLKVRSNNDGVSFALRNKEFKLRYPLGWGSYPKEAKPCLIDNLAHILTINVPLVAELPGLSYNTSYPMFKSFFDRIILRELPALNNDYKPSTEEILRRHNNITFKFRDYEVKSPAWNFDVENKALIPLSCGKDSLLTLAVCQEIGLKPVGVYINDTVSPPENRIKLDFIRRVSKEFKFNTVIVTNEVEQLNDFEHWGTEESCIGYSHMITGFIFVAMPLAHYFRAKYIALGNQQDMNFPFTNKDGFVAYVSFAQTTEWGREMDYMARRMTRGKVGVTSVIQPLTNIAITKILHGRYRDYGKYQVSCDCLDDSQQSRWCLDCNKCARLSLFMLATGSDPSQAGFPARMLDKKHEKYYRLFEGKEVDSYEKSPEAKEQQLLAFYMAYRNGVKGYLIDKFKKQFLDEAKAREDELYKKFFSIYEPETLPKDIRHGLVSIYKEELQEYLS